MKNDVTMRSGNKGLTAKVNLWSMEKRLNETDSETARLSIKGQLTNAETREIKKFNDAGELITILGKWNVQKLKALKKLKVSQG